MTGGGEDGDTNEVWDEMVESAIRALDELGDRGNWYLTRYEYKDAYTDGFVNLFAVNEVCINYELIKKLVNIGFEWNEEAYTRDEKGRRYVRFYVPLEKQEVEGVRGRQEIQGIVSDLDVLIQEAEGDAHPLLVERLAGISEDLKGLLGEVDDL